MIQILTPQFKRPPSTAEQFGRAFANLGLGAAQYIPEYLSGVEEKRRQDKEAQQLNAIIGQDVSAFSPELRKQVLASSLQGGGVSLEENYDRIKNQFGENFANVWRAAPTGAKTALMQAALKSVERGESIDAFLNKLGYPTEAQDIEGVEGIGQPEASTGMQKPMAEAQWPVFDKRPVGYTPKEWNDEKKGWRKENQVHFDENKTALKNNKKDLLATKKLRNLSKTKKLSEGFSRLLINPETGDFYSYAQILGLKSPEAQEWSKIIAQYQNRAKDAFGSRVTNFDLQSYMKQFPDLLNTPEGRDRIIRLLEINYELDGLYNKAIQKVYDHYGLDGIPPERADQIARSMIQEDTERLENEFLQLENYEGEGQEADSNMVDVIGPDGSVYEIPRDKVGELESNPALQGFRIK